MTPAGMFAMAYGQALLREWDGCWHCVLCAEVLWHGPRYFRGLTVPSGGEWRR